MKSRPTKSDSASRLRNAQRQYLARARELDPEHRSLTEIARAGGMNPSTLTRFMNDAEHEGTLSALTIRRIAEVTGVPPTSEITGPAVTGMAEQAEPFIFAGDDTSMLVRQMIAGRNAADPWVLRTRTLEMSGYLPGDVVVVDMNLAAKDGDAVCAQVYDRNGDTAETVWRVYSAPFLVAAMRDPVAIKPLLVDNDRVVIRGVITDSLRRRRAA